MTRSQHGTARPFTLVLCTRCQSALGPAMLEQLRATVRSTRRGMLVTTSCLLGNLTCPARHHRGGIALLQPCSADRVPQGPARLIGAIDSPDDLRDVRAWVQRGRWESEPLPDRLCLEPGKLRRTIATN
ncbi:hypothetical protein [Mycolicibacterium palauense]|uniref:hypothetical protein n=1 Tax=Mycolicibacterium palauense TaxID=2034511 RepID=UPI0011451F05|nr:hypothetical protein [Mycolicibacterium palauense]